MYTAKTSRETKTKKNKIGKDLIDDTKSDVQHGRHFKIHWIAD